MCHQVDIILWWVNDDESSEFEAECFLWSTHEGELPPAKPDTESNEDLVSQLVIYCSLRSY